MSATYRRWTAPRARPGSRFTTRAGVVEVPSVTEVPEVDVAELDDAAAARAGFATAAALRKWTSTKGSGTLYRIDLRLAGPDPRVALRAADDLTEAELSALGAKLDRMDRAAPATVDPAGAASDRAATRPWSPPNSPPTPGCPGTTSRSGSAD